MLATTGPCTLDGTGFRTCTVDAAGLSRLAQWCEVVVVRGFVLQRYPVLGRTGKMVVVDVYDPIHLEQLEQGREDEERQHLASVRVAAAVLNEQLLRGGLLRLRQPQAAGLLVGAPGRPGPGQPPHLQRGPDAAPLIDVVPSGLPDDPPVRDRPVLRGVVPGIAASDKLLLWGGGIYNWLDPLTLLGALDRLHHRLPEVRLCFLGLSHPAPTCRRWPWPPGPSSWPGASA